MGKVRETGKVQDDHFNGTVSELLPISSQEASEPYVAPE